MATLDLPEAARLVGEDIAHQRRTWRVQRIGWAAMAVFVAASLAGAFGVGPLAQGHARTEDRVLEVEWERVQRMGRDARLVIRSRGAARLLLEGDLVEAMTLISVDPPLAARGRSPGVLSLGVPEGRDGPGQVVLRTRTDAPAFLSATLSTTGTDGTRSLRLRVLVLP